MLVQRVLEDIIEILERVETPYMLSGSIAFNIYAIPRSTRDIDLVVELQEHTIPRFLNAVSGRYYVNEDTVREEVRRKGMFSIIDQQSSYKIDFILLTNHPYEQHKFNRRKAIVINNQTICVITLEDLILSKLIWIQRMESDLHKRDIRQLLENPDADMDYIRHWISEMNLNTYALLD
ncbi:MAG: nucleotidyl transferase AbiEii/AbiGii toxin family protein [Bacteroidales bacterium]|nr:nucleotidyl transferase AbiEii/AbiGii toxin family protein [Bacteroidales bacterium]